VTVKGLAYHIGKLFIPQKNLQKNKCQVTCPWDRAVT